MVHDSPVPHPVQAVMASIRAVGVSSGGVQPHSKAKPAHRCTPPLATHVAQTHSQQVCSQNHGSMQIAVQHLNYTVVVFHSAVCCRHVYPARFHNMVICQASISVACVCRFIASAMCDEASYSSMCFRLLGSRKLILSDSCTSGI